MGYHRSVGGVLACRWAGGVLFVALLGTAWGVAPCLWAAGQPGPANPADAEEQVTLNFAGEIEIKILVDYVSQRLGIQILYDEKIANKKISVQAPRPIPVSSLVGVLESALKMKGLALMDADVPGWKRIVDRTDLPRVAPTGEAARAIRQYGQGTAVTQVFVLKHADPNQVGQNIKQFLSDPAANTVALPQSRMLVVTDYATNLLRIARWIEQMDRPSPSAAVLFVPVQHADATDLADQVKAVLGAKAKVEGAGLADLSIEVIGDTRTNQVLLIGVPEQAQEAQQLIRSLDVPSELVTRSYTFRHVDATAIDRLARQLLGGDGAGRLYRSAVVPQENLLVVTAPEAVHRQVEELRVSRDIAQDRPQTPIRFYKVKNLPVTELLNTIQAITGVSAGVGRPAAWRTLPTDGRIRPLNGTISGPSRAPLGPAVVEPMAPPPAAELPPQPGAVPPLPGAPPLPVREPGAALRDATIPPVPWDTEAIPPAQLLGQAQVTADVNTNTLIVVAEPSVQRAYAELIRQLDERRPQVLIEAKFLIITGSDDFSFGVEVSGGDRSGSKRLFSFTSYGLSDVDAVSGALSIIPGVGLNGVLVNPEVADAVLRAVTSHRRARVVSAPRILVNDNSTGQLTSVSEVPFTSVNASQTVATTSFAGFAEAGTTITVTPHISDEDRLQLDFAITLNTFTGAGSEGIPPPRQTDELTSQITIPDGHTLIVGGLNQGNRSHTYTGFPVLDRIPVVRELFGLTSGADARSSMFVFLRPVILRDDKFRDLRFLSDRDGKRACLEPNYPPFGPIWIE